MRFPTVRNIMLTMLVVGISGSIVGLGTGTFALFSATTTNSNNTFSSAAITFSSTGNGGQGTCTSTAGATAAPAAACTGASSYIMQLATMIPGDSKTATTTLTNGGNVPVKVDLTISETGAANSLTSNSINSTGTSTAGTYGLGLLIFECRTSGHLDVGCSSGTVAELYPVYGTCGGSTFTAFAQSAGFSSSNVSISTLTDNGIKVGTSNTTCYGGNQAVGLSSLTVPIVALSGNPVVGNAANELAVSGTDNLAMILYLPYPATNQAVTTPNLTFTWTATQKAGTSS